MLEKTYLVGGIFSDLEALESLVDFAKSDGVDRLILLGNYVASPSRIKDWGDRVKSSIGLSGIRTAEAKFKAKRSDHIIEELGWQKELLDDSGIDYMVLSGLREDNADVLAVYGTRAIHDTHFLWGESSVVCYGGSDVFSLDFAPEDFKHLYKDLDSMGLCSDHDVSRLAELLKEHVPKIVLAHDTPMGLLDRKIKTSKGLAYTGNPTLKRYLDNSSPLWMTSNIENFRSEDDLKPGSHTIANETLGLYTHVLNPGWLGRNRVLDPIKGYLIPIGGHYGSFISLTTDENGEIIDYTFFMLSDGKGGIKKPEPLLKTQIKDRPALVNLSGSGLVVPSGGFNPLTDKVDNKLLRGLDQYVPISEALRFEKENPNLTGLSHLVIGDRREEPTLSQVPTFRLPELEPTGIPLTKLGDDQSFKFEPSNLSEIVSYGDREPIGLGSTPLPGLTETLSPEVRPFEPSPGTVLMTEQKVVGLPSWESGTKLNTQSIDFPSLSDEPDQ